MAERHEQTEAADRMAERKSKQIRRSGKHPLIAPRYGSETNPASESVVQNTNILITDNPSVVAV